MLFSLFGIAVLLAIVVGLVEVAGLVSGGGPLGEGGELAELVGGVSGVVDGGVGVAEGGLEGALQHRQLAELLLNLTNGAQISKKRHPPLQLGIAGCIPLCGRIAQGGLRLLVGRASLTHIIGQQPGIGSTDLRGTL